MGFFQDLKQDLSQTVNELGVDDTISELNLDDGETASEDLFGSTTDTDFADLEAMLEKEVEALGDGPTMTLQNETVQDSGIELSIGESVAGQEVETNEMEEGVVMTPDIEIEEGLEMPVEENQLSETDAEMELLLNEVEQNTQEPMYMDAATADEEMDGSVETEMAVSTDTAVITAGMSITGDVTSSGNMDLIGNITGNIDILGKLNVTGSITGNSSAAEIYAESAQINGEIKSKGSVKIGQSSVVIGNIFATSAVVAGAVKGDIDVHGPVILDTSAIVMGNIKSKSVQINNGAVIEGMCSQCYADISPASFFNEVKKNRK